MIDSISKTEKADILLTLALAFEKKLSATPEKNASGLTEKLSPVLGFEDAKILKTRAEIYDRLPPEKRKDWQKIRLDKIRGRGLSERLDGNVHPLQIAAVLDSEPLKVQLLVLKNLPPMLSRQIAAGLETALSETDYDAEQTSAGGSIHDEIVTLIRQKFISNFVALEDVFDAADTDKIPIQNFDGFIRHLGIRETAIACRGINSKETLAAFLNRFDEQSAKEIAENISGLENIKPFWVERADRLLRKNLENQFQPETLLRSLGFKVLAIAFVKRDATARRYTAQKMSPPDLREWLASIDESEREYHAAPDNERQILDRRRRIVERIAANFV